MATVAATVELEVSTVAGVEATAGMTRAARVASGRAWDKPAGFWRWVVTAPVVIVSEVMAVEVMAVSVTAVEMTAMARRCDELTPGRLKLGKLSEGRLSPLRPNVSQPNASSQTNALSCTTRACSCARLCVPATAGQHRRRAGRRRKVS